MAEYALVRAGVHGRKAVLGGGSYVHCKRLFINIDLYTHPASQKTARSATRRALLAHLREFPRRDHTGSSKRSVDSGKI